MISRKGYVNRNEEPIKWLCNHAFYSVRWMFPKKWNETYIAFGEGVISGYFLADVGAGLYGEANIPFFNITSQTPENTAKLENLATGAIISELLVLGTLPQQQRDDFKKQNPRYALGVMGVMIGATGRGLQELIY
jgi:hypothetical protein